MTDTSKDRWILLLLSILLALFYLWGMPSVPFHPDESTQIYMSSDLTTLFQDPKSLIFSPGEDLSLEMRYRAIDAPLTRYLIGTARLITGSPALESDWDWTEDWATNLAAGAYPGDSDLLVISRVIPVLLLVSSCILFYRSARRIFSISGSLFAVILFSFNPLILLHARRAMAEAALLFGICFFIWASIREKVNPWLIGLSLAVAINAKQSGAFLIPVGIIAVAVNLEGGNNLRKLLTRWSIVLGSALILTILLNPFFWGAPFQAIEKGFRLRSELTQAQLLDFLGGNVLSISQRIISLINNLYISKPVYAEAANYNAALEPMIRDYQKVLIHHWGRGLIAGSIQLACAGIGVYSLFKPVKNKTPYQKRSLQILLLSTIAVSAGLVFAFQIPWQRYILPLVPFSSLWVASGAAPLVDILVGSRSLRFPIKKH